MQVVVCDDNTGVLSTVGEQLNEHYGNLCHLQLFTNAFALLNYVQDVANGNVDIAILDIQIGDDNGILIARKLQEDFPLLEVIFMTSYLEYARDIFRAEPIYFLCKPIESNRLFEAIDKALFLLEKARKDVINIRIRNAIVRINLHKIIFIESDKRNLKIYEKHRELTIVQKLDQMEEQLPDFFLRCHQSYIVNMNYIDSLSDKITLTNGVCIPVSKNRSKNTRITFLKYIGEKI